MKNHAAKTLSKAVLLYCVFVSYAVCGDIKPGIGIINNNNLEESRLIELCGLIKGEESVLKSKIITIYTNEYKYAAYQEGWRVKLEKIGRLNFPKSLMESSLSKSVVIGVAIRSDGTIQSANVCESSGVKIIDETAIDIAMKSSPYRPFPESIKKEVDLLHIIREWKFVNKIRSINIVR